MDCSNNIIKISLKTNEHIFLVIFLLFFTYSSYWRAQTNKTTKYILRVASLKMKYVSMVVLRPNYIPSYFKKYSKLCFFKAASLLFYKSLSRNKKYNIADLLRFDVVCINNLIFYLKLLQLLLRYEGCDNRQYKNFLFGGKELLELSRDPVLPCLSSKNFKILRKNRFFRSFWKHHAIWIVSNSSWPIIHIFFQKKILTDSFLYF